MLTKTVILLFSFFTVYVSATEKINDQPLVDINVGIELGELEASAKNIEQSIRLASEALQEMAKHPNIDDEQQAKIIETFNQIDELSSTLQDTLKEIPIALTRSTPPILNAMDNLFSNIQLTIILVLVAIVLILVAALIAIYYWVLKPTTSMILQTTAKVDNMATALQTTAIIVEKTTEQQRLILNSYPIKQGDKEAP